MHQKIKHFTKKTINSIIGAPSILNSLLKDEAIGGKLIIMSAALAVAAVNSPLKALYDSLWQTDFSIDLANLTLSQDLRHWVNEGLMAIFFLVVGLEIKRELVNGELKDKKKAILPISAAIGGMIVPALIYVAFNINSNSIYGWGIPTATDIAFAVTVLALLGNRVPLALKIFLLTLAIVDDIGAIIIIAVFYADSINYSYLTAALLLTVFMWMIRRWLSKNLIILLVLGVTLWLFAHLAKIHASVVGAVLGLLALIPKSPREPSQSRSLEEFFLPISTFFVLPVFAFANAGVVLSASVFKGQDSMPIMAGIVLGLVVGKLVGISGVSWIMVRLGLAKLPAKVSWLHIVGVSIISGIGFTVSIFITDLAFQDPHQVEIAKVSIFIASGLAAVLGSLFLLKSKEIEHILDEATS